MYEQADGEMLTASALGTTPNKQQQAMKKVLQSAGSMLGDNEIDSQCRTEGDFEDDQAGVDDNISAGCYDDNDKKSK